MIRVCFVCLGNICRSPMAEGVFRALVRRAGAEGEFLVESAGTAAYHVGDPPDPRTVRVAGRHGVLVDGRGAHFTAARFDDYDHVVALDRANLRDLRRIARNEDDERKLVLLRAFDAEAAGELDVHDPYYGDEHGFEETYAVCLRACTGLLAELRAPRDGRPLPLLRGGRRAVLSRDG